jgi:hypothetical protein
MVRYVLPCRVARDTAPSTGMPPTYPAYVCICFCSLLTDTALQLWADHHWSTLA